MNTNHRFGKYDILESLTYLVSREELDLGVKYFQTKLSQYAQVDLGIKEMYVMAIADMLQYDLRDDLESGLTNDTLSLIVNDYINCGTFKSKKLTKELIDEVILAKIDNVDIGLYLILDFTPEQIREIRYGLRDQLNTLCYAFKKFSAEKMKVIREILAIDNGVLINNELSIEDLEEFKYVLLVG